MIPAAPQPLSPRVVVLAGSVDDYVIRLELGGGVVHDCTLAQASGLVGELAAAVATAERVEAREVRR